MILIIFINERTENKIPADWELKDYSNLIMNIMNNIDNDIHLYHLQTFEQEYFVFDDGYWIVIIGANRIVDTAFYCNNTKNYLHPNKGYKYLGKVREVLE
ncbi:hypothetical protein [Niallia sp. 01092]|uniref:hypothetical protein n=1 Tax=unclassified Niallia TaxID=2837522 RepID=UPI003FD2C79B